MLYWDDVWNSSPAIQKKDLELIDIISKQLSDKHKVNFDRTKTLEYLVRWEYEKEFKSLAN